jgi:hypothetical protein
MKNNDKRTKGQVLRLLESAIEQEERMGDQIKSLENALAECQKKVNDPLAELTDNALAGSKISFRIDYYKTAEKGPLKGIIEHISSRQRQTFSGEGSKTYTAFIGKYLPESKAKVQPEKASILPQPQANKIVPVQEINKNNILTPENNEGMAQNSVLPLPVQGIEQSMDSAYHASPLLQRALADIFQEKAKAKTVEIERAITLEKKPNIQIAASDQLQIIPEGQKKHYGQISTQTKFQVEVPLADLLPYTNKDCSATLLCENLETGETRSIHEQCNISKSSLRLPASGTTLPLGGYRLTAVLRIRDGQNSVQYRERRLLVVN